MNVPDMEWIGRRSLVRCQTCGALLHGRNREHVELVYAAHVSGEFADLVEPCIGDKP